MFDFCCLFYALPTWIETNFAAAFGGGEASREGVDPLGVDLIWFHLPAFPMTKRLIFQKMKRIGALPRERTRGARWRWRAARPAGLPNGVGKSGEAGERLDQPSVFIEE
mmetsp:Transcript_39619/g.105469  ORF Transcript_39619/g.105469 Transcript_39619/m.105469 type:complete len:109 (+) Transcript_39619:1074-1400(+)